MIVNQRDYAESKKDQLLKLTVREIRLEAKKLSVHLYSRKTKKALVDLILKYQKKDLIEKKIINRKEFSVDIFTAQEKIALEKANAVQEKNIISNENFNLKRLLSESFPDKKISVTDNKDGSQTILIL